MADTVDKKTRSQIMARVHGKNTSPELVLRKALFAIGFRYRLHAANLPGKPDLAFPRYRAVVFMNGCFWHWHGCIRSRMPSDNADYWKTKIELTRKRDRAHYAKLLAAGWRVMVVWECALNKSSAAEAARLAGDWLKGHEAFCIIERETRNRSRLLLSCKSRSASD